MVIPIHSIEKRMWEALVAFLMLCGGSAVMLLLYMWFVWYASLHALIFRPPHNNAPSKNGLSLSDIHKLPTLICTSNVSVLEGSEVFFLCEDMECTVCLEQLKDGEKCLIMPSCRHCFHVECAVAWLSKQAFCPVCRTRCDPQQQQQNVPDALTIHVLSQ